MTDDIGLSSETLAQAKLAGRLANAVFDKALEGDSEGFEVEADAALAEAMPTMTADDARRQVKVGAGFIYGSGHILSDKCEMDGDGSKRRWNLV